MPQEFSTIKLTLALVCASALALGILLSPIILLGCDSQSSGDSGGDTPQPTATLNIQVKRDDGTTPNVPFDVDVTWKGDVTEETGSNGATSFEDTKPYSGNTDTKGDWTAKHLYIERRPGKWDLRVTTDGWSYTCTGIDLPAGTTTTVSFTWGKSKCNVGATFP